MRLTKTLFSASYFLSKLIFNYVVSSVFLSVHQDFVIKFDKKWRKTAI